MRLLSLSVCVLVGALALASTGTVEARRGDDSDRSYRADRSERSERSQRSERGGRREERRRDGLSLDEAAAKVRRDTGGRVLTAEPRGEHYRIKVLMPDGSVRVFHVDANDSRAR